MSLFSSVLQFLIMLDGMHSSPLLLPHLSESEFAKVSRDAFKKLRVERWKKTDFARHPSLDEQLLIAGRNYTKRHPKEIDLNTAKSKELLDVGFDPRYMSEVMPSRAWQNLDNALEHRHAFEIFKEQAGSGDVVKTPFNKRIAKNKIKFEDIDLWIWNLTLCIVEPFWKDFGTKVWPRYVNVGRCSDKPTCSIPSGMKCQPSETRTINLLYKVCPELTVSSLSAKDCFWSLFQTEIVRTCRCSC